MAAVSCVCLHFTRIAYNNYTNIIIIIFIIVVSFIIIIIIVVCANKNTKIKYEWKMLKESSLQSKKCRVMPRARRGSQTLTVLIYICPGNTFFWEFYYLKMFVLLRFYVGLISLGWVFR